MVICMNREKSIGYDGKTIPKILMVSSAAFGVFSAVNQYLVIPSAVFGLAYNAINDTSSSKDRQKVLNEELIDATRRALCATRSEIMDQDSHSESQIDILNELMEGVVQPQNLKELIKKTESYQQKYCTIKDADDIISSFENHFRVELVKNDLLSRYYTLTCDVFTADKIQIIGTMLEGDSKTLSQMAGILNDQNVLRRDLSRGFSAQKQCFGEIR